MFTHHAEARMQQRAISHQAVDALMAYGEYRRHRGAEVCPPSFSDLAPERSLHVWLPMSMVDAERLTARALRAGVAVTPPDGPIVDAAGPVGIRLCLGAMRCRQALESALECVKAALKPGSDRGSQGLV